MAFGRSRKGRGKSEDVEMNNLPDQFKPFVRPEEDFQPGDEIFLGEKPDLLKETRIKWEPEGLIFKLEGIYDFTETYRGETWKWTYLITTCQGEEVIFPIEEERGVTYVSFALAMPGDEDAFFDYDDEFVDEIKVVHKLFVQDDDGEADVRMYPRGKTEYIEYADYVWDKDDSWWMTVVWWDDSEKLEAYVAEDLRPNKVGYKAQTSSRWGRK